MGGDGANAAPGTPRVAPLAISEQKTPTLRRAKPAVNPSRPRGVPCPLPEGRAAPGSAAGPCRDVGGLLRAARRQPPASPRTLALRKEETRLRAPGAAGADRAPPPQASPAAGWAGSRRPRQARRRDKRGARAKAGVTGRFSAFFVLFWLGFFLLLLS